MSFDASCSYSKTFSYEENTDPIAAAHAHAAKFLPKGTIYEVRTFDRRAGKNPKDDRHNYRSGWYYEPEMQKRALAEAGATATRSDGGADGTYVGRFVV